jgi:signal transduction histidine kinase
MMRVLSVRLRPHPLVLGLLTTSAVITAAIGWAGWRLVDQQRALDARLASEQLEVSARGMAASVREKLTEIRERLEAAAAAAGGRPWPTSTHLAVVAGHVDRLEVIVPSGLPFLPVSAPPPVRSPLFATGERAEFQHVRLEDAATEYRRLTRHADPAVRAGALFRLARVQRRLKDAQGALESTARLAAFGARPIDSTGVPAELAALDGSRLVYESSRELTKAAAVAATMRSSLDRGVWRLSRGIAETYRQLVAEKGEARPESWALAGALADVWPDDLATLTPRGQSVAGSPERPVLVLWRVNGESAALAATFVDTLVESPIGVLWQISDADDRRLAGAHGPPPASTASGVISGGGSAWTLRMWPRAHYPRTSGGARILIAGLAVVMAFVWGATYLMARVIRREAAVARLQNDFVAAVSHEFRSPLTTMRQMTEMLDAGRVPGEHKRREYYRVLVAETTRLQRLVETLLNFGRMEAGKERYERQELELGDIVCATVRDLRAQPAYASRRIDVRGPTTGCAIVGDEAALSLALRNLLDNALKYSPAAGSVRVGWRRAGDHAVVAVADEGPGIPAAERAAIFQKFVRGRSAISSRVPGSGVGLSMAQRIAVAHGGSIAVESEPGRGSTFSLRLPSAGLSASPRVAAS